MKSLTKHVAQNTIIQVIGRFLSLLLGAIIIGLMMRYLGPERYGYYSISIAFLQIVGIIADFGLYLITLKYLGEADTSQNEEQKKEQVGLIMQNIFTLRFFSAVFFYGLAVLIALFLPYPIQVKIGVLILSFSLFFSSLIQIFSAFYQKKFETIKIVIGELVGRIISLGLIILFVGFNLGFYYIISAFILSSLVNFLILFFSSRRFFLPKFRFDLKFWRQIFKDTWPIALGIVFNTIYFKIDTLILSFYRPASDVGIYGACYRVFEILITLPPLFLGLIFAEASRAWKMGDKDRFKMVMQKSFDFLVMISLPIVICVFILGPRIMELIGGEDFIQSGRVLRIIIFATGILFVAELFKQAVVNLNEQKNALKLYIFSTIVALIGYFIFIPRYSYWGAASVTLFVEALMLFLLLGLTRQKSGFSPNLRFLSKGVVASSVMAVALVILIKQNLFFSLAASWLIYFIVLYYLKGINDEVKKFFQKEV